MLKEQLESSQTNNLKRKIGNTKQLTSVTRATINDGKEASEKIIICNNGKLNFTLEENHALDIYSLAYKGINMSFLSKNGLNPKGYDFASSFPGGMLYTCGLDSIGDRTGFPLHGTLHSMNATITSLDANEEGIVIEGKIIDSKLFGKNLVLKRRIESKYNSNSIIITDTLVNASFKDEEYTMLYHINSGYPLVDSGTRIVGDFISSVPRTEYASTRQDLMFVMEEPVDNEEEVCYFHKLRNPQVSLVNEKIKVKLTINMSLDTLPCLIEWKSLASGDYVIGLEPATSFLDDGFEYKTIKKQCEIKNVIVLTFEDL